ncbi:hypothetical protein VTJ04DRAFT_4764 [Mycothermus thermophilus]|uniref:uncharacterized protein n=1 Tax=Humicola insolens TaxID=85995 RepID=UPI0037446ECD
MKEKNPHPKHRPLLRSGSQIAMFIRLSTFTPLISHTKALPKLRHTLCTLSATHHFQLCRRRSKAVRPCHSLAAILL